jgi:hypothetical protein
MNYTEFRETITWGSEDGKSYRIPEITDSHLVNILNWIKDRPKQYPTDLYGLFEQEAMLRKLVCFAKGEPVPTKQDERWMLQ